MSHRALFAVAVSFMGVSVDSHDDRRRRRVPPRIVSWPETFEDLAAVQLELAGRDSEPWRLSPEGYSIGSVFVCFPRGYGGVGAEGDRAWGGAAILLADGRIETAVVGGSASAPYRAGFLALREGVILETALRALATTPDVLLVNATGRDHPRGAGLAVQLGAVLGVPSVGVTHRPLMAQGEWPALRCGASRPLSLHGRAVGAMVCTGDGRRPLAAHAGWRTTPDDALAVILAGSKGARTPEPLRSARRVAREARTAATRAAAR
jgi:deoxyribonuclease V